MGDQAHRISHSSANMLFQKAVDFFDELIKRWCPFQHDMIVTFQCHETGTGDQGRHASSLVEWTIPVTLTMHYQSWHRYAWS